MAGAVIWAGVSSYSVYQAATVPPIDGGFGEAIGFGLWAGFAAFLGCKNICMHVKLARLQYAPAKNEEEIATIAGSKI